MLYEVALAPFVESDRPVHIVHAVTFVIAGASCCGRSDEELSCQNSPGGQNKHGTAAVGCRRKRDCCSFVPNPWDALEELL
ncbi:unnamed protein product [Durusdinium trenchii]|uniref:Uncharacterized protein n=1 Tax=Durusdinium trenchii TaxID=1381693 RepID=A0ABP0QEN8_9DINO